MTDALREAEMLAFEDWMRWDSTLPLDRDSFDYADFHVAVMWHAWEARAAIAAPAVPPADEQRESMAMMLRKCAHALQHRGREDLAADVVGLLRRYDLLGSPLRAPTAPPVKQSLTTAAQPSESNPQR